MKKKVLALLSSSLFKRTMVYSFSAYFNAFAALLIMPVLTKFLTPYDFGIVETFVAVLSFLTGIVLFGGNTLISKDYFILNQESRRQEIGTVLTIVLLISITFFVIEFVSSKLTTIIMESLKLSPYIILLVISVAFFNAIFTILMVILQLEKKTLHYAFILNSKTVLDLTLSLILIVVFELGWLGRLTGISVASFVFFAISIYFLAKMDIHFAASKKFFRTIIVLGSPLMLAHITGWAMEMIDKLMINHLISVQGTGLYSVGYKFGMVIMMIEVAFSRAWLPFFYEKVSGEISDKILIVKVSYIYILGLISVSVLFGIFGKYILYYVVDERYFVAGKFVFLISMAYCFDGIWKIFLGYLIFLNKTKTYSTIVAISALTNVALNYVLLPRIGLIGAAWATFLSFVVGAMLTAIISIKSYSMPWIDFGLLLNKKLR